MGEIMENKRQDNNAPKEENDVRIGMSSIVGKVIGYCNLLLTEKKFRNIKFTAVGGAIGKLVNVVENLKVFHAGLNQSNFLTTVSYQAVDRTGKVFNERLHPKMEVNLSLDKIAAPEQGFVQDVLPEEERKTMQALMDKRREERQKEGENRPQREEEVAVDKEEAQEEDSEDKEEEEEPPEEVSEDNKEEPLEDKEIINLLTAYLPGRF